MRLIVGPLPAAIYWRRRAVVIGGVLVAVLMTAYACQATGSPANSSKVSATPTAPAGSNPSSDPSPTPSVGVIAPAAEVSASPTPTSEPGVDPKLCTDSELRVTVRSGRVSLARGAELTITLLVKNTAKRSCTRDVGADAQELRLVQGTEKVWSSDDCGGLRGHDVRQFPAGHERSYTVIWNGKSSRYCVKTGKRTPDGPEPKAGEYQLFGRVGTDLSEPLDIKLT